MQNKLRMPSKETILTKIKSNRPNLWPLPDVPIFETLATDKKKLFIQILERGGSKVHCIDDSTQIHQVITTHFPEDKRMVSSLPFLEGIERISTLHPDFYEGTEVAIIEGLIGVAENGALWVTENELGYVRVLPFIAQHLVMVISEKNIVGTMHEAYKKLGLPTTAGFGVIIMRKKLQENPLSPFIIRWVRRLYLSVPSQPRISRRGSRSGSTGQSRDDHQCG